MSGDERQLRSIYELMPLAIAKVGAVGKRGRNAQQNFQFRTIDDVYSAVHAALAQASISVGHEFELVSDDPSGQKTRNGTMRRVIVKLTTTLYGQDGSCIQSITFGEGTDSGDKAVSKAHTMALKTLLISTFCIPLKDVVDPDSISIDPVADVEMRRKAPVADDELAAEVQHLAELIERAPDLQALRDLSARVDKMPADAQKILKQAGKRRFAALKQEG